MDTIRIVPNSQINLADAPRPAQPTRFQAEGAGGIPLKASPAKLAAIKKTASDFEAFFMSSMLESMTAGIKSDKIFGGGKAEDMYRSMLNQEYGKAIAARGTLGLGAAIQSEMIRMQEMQS